MPLLEKREQLTPTKEYRFIRLEDTFSFEEINYTDRREHKDLALTTKLFKGTTSDDKPIVTDGGKMIAFVDHVTLTIEWTGSTQIEAMIGFDFSQANPDETWDRIQLDVHKETSQKLADLLCMPVIMQYKPVVPHSHVIETTFTPR